MTKEEVQAFLQDLGVKAVKVTDDIVEKVENAKAQLDTETRRKVRTVWICVTVIGFVAGVGIGVLI